MPVLGIKRFNERLYFAGLSFNRITYRFPEKSKHDVFILFRIYKRIIQAIKHNSSTEIKRLSDSSIAIYDASSKAIDLRVNYIESITKENVGFFISKDMLIRVVNFTHLLFSILFLVLAFFPLLLLSVCNKNKLKYPLIAIEFLECFNLLILVKKYKIDKIHYFCIYERDSNLCAYVLMKNKLYINKIPSEVPLVFFNKIIIADSLSICFKYQEEEVRKFNQTIFVDTFNSWIPEYAFLAPAHYHTNKEKNNLENHLGFYSSANWLREYKGDCILDYNEKSDEEFLLNCMIEYATSHPQIKLVIYRHPLEKRTEYKELSTQYYSNKIKAPNIILAPLESRTADCFDKVELAVALYSTIMFERIFFGYKTLLMPLSYIDFFLKDSNLFSVCAADKNDLFIKIDLNLKYSTDEYFKNNKLDNYHIGTLTEYFKN